jgi:hypothetical protein
LSEEPALLAEPSIEVLLAGVAYRSPTRLTGAVELVVGELLLGIAPDAV